MNCQNCHSDNKNVKISKPWSLVCYLICFTFGGTGILQMLGGDFSGPAITCLVMGLLFFYLARNLTVYSYYCNNCREKWDRTDLG
jgi:hypothetical protein